MIRAVHVGAGIGNINRMEAHFPFDEQTGAIARDVVGSREANINSASQWKPGGWNGALGFDGSGDYLKFGSDSGLQLERSFSPTGGAFWQMRATTVVLP